MMLITFDDSKPGFNARRWDTGGLIGYRFKKWGLFLSLRLVSKQVVSNSLGAHISYKNQVFNDGVRQLGVLAIPAFVFFGALLNVSLLVGVPNPEFRDALAEMRKRQESEAAPPPPAEVLEQRAETGGASGTDWS